MTYLLTSLFGVFVVCGFIALSYFTGHLFWWLGRKFDDEITEFSKFTDLLIGIVIWLSILVSVPTFYRIGLIAITVMRGGGE